MRRSLYPGVLKMSGMPHCYFLGNSPDTFFIAAACKTRYTDMQNNFTGRGFSELCVNAPLPDLYFDGLLFGYRILKMLELMERVKINFFIRSIGRSKIIDRKILISPDYLPILTTIYMHGNIYACLFSSSFLCVV